MPLVRFLGVEHLAQGENYAGNGGGLQQFGWTFTLVSNANAAPRLTIAGNKIAYGRKATATSLVTQGVIGTKFTNLLGDKSGVSSASVTQIAVGFRAAKAAGASPASGLSVMGLLSTAPTSSNTGIFNGVYYNGTQWRYNYGGTTGVLSSADEVYIDLVLRNVGNIVYLDIWADGTRIINGYNTTWNWATFFSTGHIVFGCGINGGSPTQDTAGTLAKDFVYVSDVYVTINDGTSGDTFNDRLGPVRIQKCPVTQVTQTDWTSSDGTTPIKDIMNTRRDVNNSVDQTASPVAISGLSASAMNCQVDASAVNGSIFAMQVSASACHPSGDSGNMQIDVISGGSSIMTKQYTDIPVPAVYNDRTPLPITTIGGAAPTPASVNALTIAVKPI